MSETITGNTDAIKIDNPEQASTNFYWTYASSDQTFNLQTTIRGILTFDQIKAHIKSALEACAHVHELGGQAKQVGRSSYETIVSSVPIPAVQSIESIGTDLSNAGVVSDDLSFSTEFLSCNIANGKKYFKVKGKPWSKYGVTVWPEKLTEAGIPWEKLEAKEYELTGYKATYVKNEKGQPEKVIKLEKV